MYLKTIPEIAFLTSMCMCTLTYSYICTHTCTHMCMYIPYTNIDRLEKHMSFSDPWK